jgi:hypothetical protein
MLNDNNIEVEMQGMPFKRCVMCHLFKNSTSSHTSTKSHKGFIIYNFNHGIMTMKKHVTNKHG